MIEGKCGNKIRWNSMDRNPIIGRYGDAMSLTHDSLFFLFYLFRSIESRFAPSTKPFPFWFCTEANTSKVKPFNRTLEINKDFVRVSLVIFK